MSAYDLMLSESQERMLIVCKPSSWEGLKSFLTSGISAQLLLEK